MKPAVTKSLGLSVGVAAVSLIAYARAQSPGTQPVTVSAPKIAQVKQAYMAPSTLDAINGAASVEVYTKKQSVTLLWAYSKSSTVTNISQIVPLEYWPTAAESVDDVLYVAGKTKDRGRTVIEKWTFSYQGFPATLPVIQRVQVYNNKEDGKTDIRWFERMDPTSPFHQKLLCQFGDSKDVGAFDLTSGQLQTDIASSAFIALQSPDHLMVWSGVHQTHGWFCVMQRSPLFGPFDPIVMFDSDRDGELDTWSQFQGQSYWDAVMGVANVDYVVSE